MELIKKERYLSVEKMAEIYSAFEELNSLLEDIKLPRAELQDSTVTYGISPADILDKMNMVERNIKTLHDRVYGKIIGWTDSFYKDFQWTARTYEKKTEVDRWIDWTNSFFTMLSNVRVEYIPIFNTSGAEICDSNGNQLYFIKRIYEVN